MRSTRFFTLIILSVFSAGSVSAAVNLTPGFGDKSIEINAETSFQLLDRGLSGMTVDINLPLSVERYAQSAELDALLFGSDTATKGESPFPFITRWLRIPAGVKVSARIKNQSGRRLRIDDRGNVSYIDNLDTAFEESGSISHQDNPAARIGIPAEFRGIYLLPLLVSPIQYLENEELLFENRSLTLELDFTPDLEAPAVLRPVPMSPAMSDMIGSQMINPPARDLADASRGRILVLYSDRLEDEGTLISIQAFADWKRRLGYKVIVEAVDVNRQGYIRNGLVSFYYGQPESLEFLIILGHWDLRELDEDSPLYFPSYTYQEDTVTIHSDQYYVTLGGEDDLLPDVIVGRFMSNSLENLSYALSRSIAYEQDPQEGEWLGRAAYQIGSLDPPLMESLDIARWSGRRLRELGYTDVDTLWESIFEFNGESGLESLENGVSLALSQSWMHGAVIYDWEVIGQDSIYTLVDTASVGRMHPFIITNAEHYLDPILVPFFNAGSREEPNGCVAGFGFWPLDINYRSSIIIGWSVWAMRFMDQYTGGYLFQFAGIQMLPWINFVVEEYMIRMEMAQLHYLGDPTLQVRTGAAAEFDIVHPETYATGTSLVDLLVNDGDGNPVPGAVICIRQTTRDGFHYTAETSPSGMVHFTVPEGLAEGDLQVTASRHNFKAVSIDIPVRRQAVNIVLETGGFDDENGMFANGETVDLAVTFRNTGDDRAEGLTAAFSSDCEYLNFSRENEPVEAINAGETGTLADSVEMTLDTGCPGGELVQLRIVVSDGNSEWRAAFEIETSGPRLVIEEVNQLRLERNRLGRMTPVIRNTGDMDAPDLNAVLSCSTPGITVTGAERTYPVLDPQDTAEPNQHFMVRVGSAFIPGDIAEFRLELNAGEEYNVAVDFKVVIDVPDSSDPLGPDNHGYICFDSEDGWGNRPEYRWIEINRNADDAPPDACHGSRVDLGEFEIDADNHEWDEVAAIELPFGFQYYGEVYDSLVVCSNGWLSLGTSSLNVNSDNNWAIPYIGSPDAQLAIYWLDLRNALGYEFNGVYQYYAAERGIFIIEWSQVAVNGDTLRPQFRLDCQIQLFDPSVYETPTGDGEIIFQYKTYMVREGAQRDEHPYPLIGIRSNDGTDGIMYSFRNNEYEGAPVQAVPLHDEFALKFTTLVEAPVGSITGSVFRASEPDVPIPGATVDLLRVDPVLTDQQGRFILRNVRTGRYEIRISAAGFNTLVDSIEIEPGIVLEPGPYLLTHPEPFIEEEYRELNLSLRPDGSRTPVHFVLRNLGSGPVVYNTEVRFPNGRVSAYEVFDSVFVDAVFRAEPILPAHRIRGYAPVVTDDDIFISLFVRTPRDKYIARANRNNELLDLFEQPIPEDDISGCIKCIAWDGQQILGSYNSRYDGPVIIKFDLDGNISDTISLPFENSATLPLIYSPERSSIFITDAGEDIIEFDENGEVVSRFRVEFPGRVTSIKGFGWNIFDTDNMPLYFIDDYHLDGETPYVQFMKADPATGEYMEISRITYDPENMPGSIYGLSIIPDYDSMHSAFAYTETYGTPILAQDYIKIREFAPNTTFMLDNSFVNQAGEIPPRGRLAIGFEVELTGHDHDSVFRWSYYVTHNAAGEAFIVEVTLTVDTLSGLDESGNLLPQEFALQAVYPNPFNSITRISFSVDRAAQAGIHVYDLSGRFIDTVYDDMAAPGIHIISWNAEKLPSGVYVLRLESNGKASSRKVVLMR